MGIWVTIVWAGVRVVLNKVRRNVMKPRKDMREALT